MRIISGVAGGRKLAAPPARCKSIRPTSDRAREALFNILGERVAGSRVLDLFAGTGALGLEALSRGAEHIVLVEYDRVALELISKNLKIFPAVNISKSVTVLRHDLCRGLPKKLTHMENRTPFNLIFLDPPYSKGLSLKALEWLTNQKALLASDVCVVVEERSSETLPDKLAILGLSDQRTYGEAGFWFYTLL